jgi:hypothetical protein
VVVAQTAEDLLRRDAMFQLLRAVSRLDIFGRQVPCLAVSFVVAAAFYKFDSFALECAGFLTTWFILDLLYEGVAGVLRRRQAELSPSQAGR